MMREFDTVEAAIDHACHGEQGLYVASRPAVPAACDRKKNKFLAAVRDLAPREVAMLYDHDFDRLVRMRIELKAWYARIYRRGMRGQHIILTGWAVDRARKRCKRPEVQR